MFSDRAVCLGFFPTERHVLRGTGPERRPTQGHTWLLHLRLRVHLQLSDALRSHRPQGHHAQEGVVCPSQLSTISSAEKFKRCSLHEQHAFCPVVRIASLGTFTNLKAEPLPAIIWVESSKREKSEVAFMTVCWLIWGGEMHLFPIKADKSLLLYFFFCISSSEKGGQ